MIGGTLQRTGGTMSVAGLDPAERGPEVRAHLGVVPQQDNLDEELSVRDNLIMYGRYFGLPYSYLRAKADELLEFAQLADRGREKVGALSGHEAPPDDRQVARQRAEGAAPRRADDRPRPAGQACPLGPPLPAQGGRCHARRDDPLHGRGRAAVRPARRHRPRSDHGRGHATPAHPRALDAGGARGPLRGRPQRGVVAQLEDIGSRIEVLPDRILVYADDGEAALEAVAAHQPSVPSPRSCAGRRSRTSSCA